MAKVTIRIITLYPPKSYAHSISSFRFPLRGFTIDKVIGGIT